jgi:heptosyltransferase-1
MIYLAAGLRSACRPKQNWSAAAWLELANALPDHYQLVALDAETRPALGRTKSATDAEFYNHPRVKDLTGQTADVRHAAALVDRCSLYVGVDTGLIHIAHALGKPTINLCAAAPEAARTPLSGLNIAFEGRAACFPCQYLTACPHNSHCLDWVTGKAVARAIEELIAPKPCPSRRLPSSATPSGSTTPSGKSAAPRTRSRTS